MIVSNEWVTLPDWMAIKRKRYTLQQQTDEPEFVGIIPNLTVSVGRDAKFPCIVNNLDTYRLCWARWSVFTLAK
ncbi:hypothetical protein BLA29_008821 [Euroglyphus maynei]|uniref:Ig-like domain-containing protein n=1 Tax=Euroglyphus maynei TaxID=6958 RepID=A0A1Y3B7X6_EURMA|nr:hypothetical protein BLA29_008821 [Euroglyphus maynei]